jgi:hypothetical protein
MKAKVILFKPSGKYYAEEEWTVPEFVRDHSPERGTYTRKVLGPYDMDKSPDFHRIDGGSVLVCTQEPWGFPHLFPARIFSPVGKLAMDIVRRPPSVFRSLAERAADCPPH